MTLVVIGALRVKFEYTFLLLTFLFIQMWIPLMPSTDEWWYVFFVLFISVFVYQSIQLSVCPSE